MRNLLFFILICLSACKEISFETPQPKDKRALKSVPKDLQGKYLVIEEEGKPGKDTIVITSNGYHFGYFNPEDRQKKAQYDQGTLSDSLVLKSYKNYYFLSLNDHPEWLLRILQPQKNGDLLYMTFDDKSNDFNAYLKKLSQQIKIDSVLTESETLYRIDPTADQLVELIRSNLVSQTRLARVRK